jgi:hypothetical protein
VITGNESFIGERFFLDDCYPNPTKGKTTVRFMVNSASHVSINLYNQGGDQVGTWVSGTYIPGEHKVDVDVSGLPPGNYIYQLKCGFYKESKKLIVLK